MAEDQADGGTSTIVYLSAATWLAPVRLDETIGFDQPARWGHRQVGMVPKIDVPRF